ncbi:MAG: DUF4388 domain-containing protein [Acidobacteriota bacterium]
MSLEGEIADIDLVGRLVELGREHFTGAIRFENDGIIKIIYFKGGDVLSASTNDRTDSVDEILLRAGKVTREHVKQALAKRKESETLGDALLVLGFITRKELTWGRRVQVIGVIRSVSAWPSGSYTIVNDYLPKREEGTLFPLRQLLLELIVTEQDRPKFDRALEAGEAVFAKSPDFEAEFTALGLNEEAEQIVAAVDGHLTAGDVAATSGKDTFNVYKLLHALHVLGLLVPVGKPQAVSEFDFDSSDELATAGVADAADMWGRPEPSYQFDNEPVVPEPVAALEPPIEAPAPMPSWEPPPPSSSAVAQSLTPGARLDLSSDPSGGWGFDDAQLETARRASRPADDRSEADREDRPRRGGLLLVLLGLVILGAGGYYGWKWWQGRQNVATQQAQVAQPRSRRTVAQSPVSPGVITESGGHLSTTSSAIAGPGGNSVAGTATGPTPPMVSTTGIVVSPAAGALNATATSPAGPGNATGAGKPLSTGGATGAPTPSATVTGRPETTGRPGANPTTRAPLTTSAPAGATKRPSLTPSSTTASSGTRIERSGAGAIITNDGAAPSGSGTAGDREEYDALASANAHNGGGKFTVQFELVCETASIKKAMSAGGGKVWFVPVAYRGKSCYRVFWGHYESRDQAGAAISQIPASLREAMPVVVTVPK